MKENLRLFISGKEVEFTTSPKIVYNYKDTDLTNPTIVKNSYSKTIEIPGTENNNDLFGHIWNLERTQYEAIGGAGFNPMKKAPFELYLNGNIIEKGYCKLDTIKKEDRALSYSIHLYGGLGSFFYNLSYDEASDDDRKKTLADLHYPSPYEGSEEEPNLDFIINKDTVLQAWSTIINHYIADGYDSYPTGQDQKWQIINFVPCYNGIPQDFDANKILVNHSGLTSTPLQRSVGGTSAGILYRTVQDGVVMTATTRNYGYTMVETNDELTEWQTKDLRSYLQRPAVSVYYTLKACFMPENNGGYQVKLGDHFFNDGWNESYQAGIENNYYKDAWMTLPMLRDLEITGGSSEEVTGATLTKVDDTHWRVNIDSQSLGDMSHVRIKVNPVMTPAQGYSPTANNYYTHHYWETSYAFTLMGGVYVHYFTRGAGYIMQLIARNSNGTVVSASKAYAFSNSMYAADGSTPIWKQFWIEGYDDTPEPEYEFVSGHWHKSSNNQWVFVDDAGYQKDIAFELPVDMGVASLEFKVKNMDSTYIKYWGGSFSESVHSTTYLSMYDAPSVYGNFGLVDQGTALGSGRTSMDSTLRLDDFYAVVSDYEAMFSDSYIPKEKLLSTPFTPAEFLLSYAKMFGLYFYYDPSEQADDPVKCPNGVIHIMDRHDFFTGEVVDLEHLIDRSKTMEIAPTLAESKFYQFEQEPIESEAEEGYEATYGHTYGRQLVNTGYNFDSNTNNLYDGNVFKSALMAWEKDGMYKKANTGNQPYIYSGIKQTLFRTGDDGFDTQETAFTSSIINTGVINFLGNDFKDYDLMPKMQFHTDDNDASEGAYVLCFYQYFASDPRTDRRYYNGNAVQCVSGGTYSGGSYFITDDVSDMVFLNDGTPCWLMTNNDYRMGGDRIAWRINRLPFFTRDYFIQEPYTSGRIIHSWNFGHPKVTFLPKTYSTTYDSIYDMMWKDYIRDLYNVDSRKLKCYVTLQGHPGSEAMRKFYWFDNGIWRLNEVKDWNVFGNESTLCEFIKIQDVDDYDLKLIQETGVMEFEIEPTHVPANNASFAVKYTMQMDSCWSFDFDSDIIGYYVDDGTFADEIYLSGACGALGTRVVTLPDNNTTREIRWFVRPMWGDSLTNSWSGNVYQAAKPYANLSWPITPFNGYAKRFTIPVQSNVDWTPISTASSWLTVRKEGDSTLIIEASANRSTSSRSGTVRLLYNGTSLAFKSLTQEPLG